MERQVKFGNVRIQEAGCRMKREGWVFRVKFRSTSYLKDAIAAVL